MHLYWIRAGQSVSLDPSTNHSNLLLNVQSFLSLFFLKQIRMD